jgi:hypothetical protein
MQTYTTLESLYMLRSLMLTVDWRAVDTGLASPLQNVDVRGKGAKNTLVLHGLKKRRDSQPNSTIYLLF